MLTSVVILVTSPAVEYLSISENEKDWIFSYIAILRFAASPDEEYAANRAARMPKSVLKHAIRSISPPYLYTSGMLPAFIPLSIKEAVTYGIRTPIITSAVVHKGVSKAAALYCFT